MSIGTSYGKLIITGEHSVVYKMPAISIPIFTVETKVSIKNNESLVIESKYGKSTKDLRLSEHEGIFKIVEEFSNKYNTTTNIYIKVESEIPSQGGLGSSAAVSKAVLFALINHFNINLTLKEKYDFIQIGEKVHHRSPSGIDAKTVLLEKPIYFRNGKTKNIKINFDGYLIVGDTGNESMTLEAVSVVSEFRKNNPKRFNKLLKEFKKIAHNTKKALAKNDYNLLKSAIINNQLLLEEVGVSDLSLDKLIRVANNNGASAAKLTGGGLGGAMFALSKNKDIALKIKEELINEGASTAFIIDLGDFNEKSSSN